MSTKRRNLYGAAADRRKKVPKAPDASTARVRTEPIRVTLDLAPKQHAELKRWCNAAAAELDLSAVGLAPVLRLLGEELVKNPELADTIKAHLREQADQI